MATLVYFLCKPFCLARHNFLFWIHLKHPFIHGSFSFSSSQYFNFSCSHFMSPTSLGTLRNLSTLIYPSSSMLNNMHWISEHIKRWKFYICIYIYKHISVPNFECQKKFDVPIQCIIFGNLLSEFNSFLKIYVLKKWDKFKYPCPPIWETWFSPLSWETQSEIKVEKQLTKHVLHWIVCNWTELNEKAVLASTDGDQGAIWVENQPRWKKRAVCGIKSSGSEFLDPGSTLPSSGEL